MVTGHYSLTGEQPVVILQGMFLRDLLPQHGITSIAALRQRLGLTKQYAWLLWHGKVALSVDMMRRLHGELGVPLDSLLQVERAEPAKRRGRKPLRQPLQSRTSTSPAEEKS
jgi:transcriptional regulator with XRE-family HTH domain